MWTSRIILGWISGEFQNEFWCEFSVIFVRPSSPSEFSWFCPLAKAIHERGKFGGAKCNYSSQTGNSRHWRSKQFTGNSYQRPGRKSTQKSSKISLEVHAEIHIKFINNSSEIHSADKSAWAWHLRFRDQPFVCRVCSACRRAPLPRWKSLDSVPPCCRRRSPTLI